jgi:hypothetical protein
MWMYPATMHGHILVWGWFSQDTALDVLPPRDCRRFSPYCQSGSPWV